MQAYPSEWLKENTELYFGPAYTSFGNNKIWVKPSETKQLVQWECDFHKTPTKIEVRLLEQEPLLQRLKFHIS